MEAQSSESPQIVERRLPNGPDEERERRDAETAAQSEPASQTVPTEAPEDAPDGTDAPVALIAPAEDEILLAALPLAEGAAIATVSVTPEGALSPEAGASAASGDVAATDDGGSSAAAEPHNDDGFGTPFGVHPRGPFEGLPRPPLEVPEHTADLPEEDPEPLPEPEQPVPPTPPNTTPYPDEPLNPVDLLCEDGLLDLSVLDEPDQESPHGPDQGPTPEEGAGNGAPPPCPQPHEPYLDVGPDGVEELSIIA